ncbi:hypothetical protein [Streptomyces monomycini]|uniref:hypothetical protein n=1 Tax=Streptomyces monomycini TaxID=371720 RepID=UPI0012FEAFE1|nr:hypothetical protein [Streptomyces monomycini]
MQALEVGDGFGRAGVERGDLPQVVFAVRVDAAAVAVGAGGDDGPAVVGVQVNGQAPGRDVVVDVLGLVGDVTDFVAVQPV